MNINFQIEKTTDGSVLNGNNVIFDNILTLTGDIEYNSATGVITLNKTGIYLLEWFVSTQTSKSTIGAVFSITGTNINPSSIKGNSPLKTGEVMGISVIEVTDTPAIISLINDSNQEVWYSTINPVKASLVIESHNELENLVDGNSIGSVRGIQTLDNYTMGELALAMGHQTVASGYCSYAEGYNTTASGDSSHAEGYSTTASGDSSHAEGENVVATGKYSHAEGNFTNASGENSHTEGFFTIASGKCSHAEGSATTASKDYSHAEGTSTIASGFNSHAEGSSTTASGDSSHAEGNATNASGGSSHAEGSSTTASGVISHAEGYGTIASGDASHAEGSFTDADNQAGAHIMGKYGSANTAYSWFLANGIDSNTPGLAAKILTDGNAYIDVAWNTGGADYAEMFETEDGNPIEPGYFITLATNEKVNIYSEGTDDFILGISSASSGIVGDTGELRWKDKFETDEWGRIIYHEVTIPEVKDKDDNSIIKEHTEIQPKLNVAWNPNETYIPRRNRKEWIAVGLIGKLLVRDDGTCQVGECCMPNENGIATASVKGYKVLKRINDNQIKIFFR